MNVTDHAQQKNLHGESLLKTLHYHNLHIPIIYKKSEQNTFVLSVFVTLTTNNQLKSDASINPWLKITNRDQPTMRKSNRLGFDCLTVLWRGFPPSAQCGHHRRRCCRWCNLHCSLAPSVPESVALQLPSIAVDRRRHRRVEQGGQMNGI